MESIYQREKALQDNSIANVRALLPAVIPTSDSCCNAGNPHPNVLVRCTKGKVYNDYSNIIPAKKPTFDTVKS